MFRSGPRSKRSPVAGSGQLLAGSAQWDGSAGLRASAQHGLNDLVSSPTRNGGMHWPFSFGLSRWGEDQALRVAAGIRFNRQETPFAPHIRQIGVMRRQAIARLAGHDDEARLVERGEVVDSAIAGAMDARIRPPPIVDIAQPAVQRVLAAIGRKVERQTADR